MKRYRLLFPLLVCLILTACGSQDGQASQSHIVYTSQAIPFTSPLYTVESDCVFEDALYLLGTAFIDSPGGDRDLSLVRVPLEGGEAEALPNFRPVQLEVDEAYESTGGYLRPGADGTIWLTERIYVSGRGTSLLLRHLDGEGNELSSFNSMLLQDELGEERFYDLWTDGSGTYFVNTGGAVVLLDEGGSVRATLEGGNMEWNRFVPLGDGRTAILGSTRSVDGSHTSLLYVIDTEAGNWAEDAFSVPSSATCFQSGIEKDILFYYKYGDALYAWKRGAEEAERVMSWLESGVDANGLSAFSFLTDGRLAAVTYSNHGIERLAQLTLLTPTDANCIPPRAVLSMAAFTLDNDMRAEIASFNNSSDSCFISVTECLPYGGFYTEADIQQAVLRMTTALVAGELPDILYLNFRLPVRRMEALGMLENLWPYIDADPELSRSALMERPLEAMEYKGGLYRIAGALRSTQWWGQKRQWGTS